MIITYEWWCTPFFRLVIDHQVWFTRSLWTPKKSGRQNWANVLFMWSTLFDKWTTHVFIVPDHTIVHDFLNLCCLQRFIFKISISFCLSYSKWSIHHVGIMECGSHALKNSLKITNLHNGMILFTLSISFQDFTFGFSKRPRTIGYVVPYL